jgi:hypothetical protein
MPRLFQFLSEELPASDLQSLMLDVYRARVRNGRSRAALADAERNAVAAPSSIDARRLNAFDSAAFRVAAAFEAVDLSPVCTLGTNHFLGGIDQNNVLTTIRGVELLGDPTPAMAYECARRRRRQRAPEPPVRLCASQRVVRLQPFDVPGFTPHFRLFGLVSAGRDTGSNAFEVRHLREHIAFYLGLCRDLNASGFELRLPLVEVSDMALTEILLGRQGVTREHVRQAVRAHMPGSAQRFLAERGIELPEGLDNPAAELADLPRDGLVPALVMRLDRIRELVIGPLRQRHPEASFRFNFARLEGLGYYSGLCLRISPEAPDGNRYPIIDGGFTDWTARLLQDRKERMFATGIGSEFVCRRYDCTT